MPATRLVWSDLPAALVAEIGVVLGSPVVSARSQSTGFSPGLADRVIAADGTRAFVKAVSLGFAPVSHQLYNTEARVLGILPPSVRAPRLLARLAVDDWIALVIDEVDGHHPTEPPTEHELRAVLDAVHAHPSASGMGLPSVTEQLVQGFGAWRRILAAGTDGLVAAGLPEWVIDHASEIADLAASAPARLDGDRLVHLDLRADNVLLDEDGAAWILDWPWASVGAPWLDGLTMLLDARMYGGAPERVLREHPLFADVAADSVDAVLAGLAGLFFEGSRQPAPPNMPTIRRFQAREAAASLRWLRERRFPRAR